MTEDDEAADDATVEAALDDPSSVELNAIVAEYRAGGKRRRTDPIEEPEEGDNSFRGIYMRKLVALRAPLPGRTRRRSISPSQRQNAFREAVAEAEWLAKPAEERQRITERIAQSDYQREKRYRLRYRPPFDQAADDALVAEIQRRYRSKAEVVTAEAIRRPPEVKPKANRRSRAGAYRRVTSERNGAPGSEVAGELQATHGSLQGTAGASVKYAKPRGRWLPAGPMGPVGLVKAPR